MDIGEIITRVLNTLDGYDEKAVEVLDDAYMMKAIGDAVLDLKKELKRPIAEIDLTLTAGERGFTLPTSPKWFDWADEVTAIRLDPSGQNSEGSRVMIVPEDALDA